MLINYAVLIFMNKREWIGEYTVGNGTTIEVEPIHQMEKILFAIDELTGLIWSASLMRPSKSTKDMELNSNFLSKGDDGF